MLGEAKNADGVEHKKFDVGEVERKEQADAGEKSKSAKERPAMYFPFDAVKKEAREKENAIGEKSQYGNGNAEDFGIRTLIHDITIHKIIDVAKRSACVFIVLVNKISGDQHADKRKYGNDTEIFLQMRMRHRNLNSV